MKKWGRVELATVVVISTGHMFEDDSRLLDKRRDGQRTEFSEDSDHWSNSIHILIGEYGYMISVASAQSNIEIPPKWLMDICEMAADIGATWIQLDRDAVEVEGLPTYDW